MDSAVTASYGRLLDRMFVVLALFLASGAMLLFFAGPNGEERDSAVRTAVWLLVYGVGGARCLADLRTLKTGLIRNPAIAAILLLAVASAAWSVNRNLTGARAVGLVGTGLVGLHIGMRYEVSEILEMLAVALGLAAIFSAVASLAIPGMAVHHGMHEGAWRGVFLHKNHLGRAMTLAIPTFLALLWLRPRMRFRAVCGALLSLVLLFKSGSMMSFSVTVGLMFLTPAVVIAVRSHRLLLVPAVTCAIAFTFSAVALMLASYQQVLSLLGRDPTFTGRTFLWGLAASAVAAKPLLGHGFGAFWSIESPHGAAIWRLVGWQPAHGHNGFLDAALGTGLVGLTLLIIGYLTLFARSAAVARSESTIQGWWLIFVVGVLIAANIGESVLPRQNTVFWIVFVALSEGVRRWHERKRSLQRS